MTINISATQAKSLANSYLYTASQADISVARTQIEKKIKATAEKGGFFCSFLVGEAPNFFKGYDTLSQELEEQGYTLEKDGNQIISIYWK